MENTTNFPTRQPVRKTISGTEYVAQFNGLGFALDTVDKSYIQGSTNLSAKKLAQQIFDHVIVEPKGLTPDSFNDIDVFNEVLVFGRDVMQGKIKASDMSDNFRSEPEPEAAHETATSSVGAGAVDAVPPSIE